MVQLDGFPKVNSSDMDLYRACKAIWVPLSLSLVMSACSPGASVPAEPDTTSQSTSPQTSSAPTSGAGTTSAEDQSSATPDSSTDSSTQDNETVPLPGSLLEKVQTTPELSELNKFIQSSKLEAEFLRVGPRTLFAPSNTAFTELSAAQALTLAQNPELLKRLLRHHLVAQDIKFKSNVTVAGHPLVFGVGPDGQTILLGASNAGFVTKSNIQANNGTLNIIDAVIWPPKENLLEAIEGDIKYQKLAQIIKASGFGNELAQEKVYTLFAPNNDAIDELATRMGQAKFDAMMKDPAQLKALLMAHLHLGTKSPNHFQPSEEFASLDPNKPLRARTELKPAVRFTINGREYDTSQETLTKNGILVEVFGTLHDGP